MEVEQVAAALRAAAAGSGEIAVIAGAPGIGKSSLAPTIEPLTPRARERTFADAAGLARPLLEEVPDRAAGAERVASRRTRSRHAPPAPMR